MESPDGTVCRPDNTWWRPFQEAGILLILALALTAASWAIRSDRLALQADADYYRLELAAPRIDPASALARYEVGDCLFIDTRAAPEDSLASIPGSIPIRAATFDDDLLNVFDFMGPSDPVILFGSGNLLPVSNIAARLKERGYSDLQILRGGLKAWIKVGGPVTAGQDSGKDS